MTAKLISGDHARHSCVLAPKLLPYHSRLYMSYHIIPSVLFEIVSPTISQTSKLKSS